MDREFKKITFIMHKKKYNFGKEKTNYFEDQSLYIQIHETLNDWLNRQCWFNMETDRQRCNFSVCGQNSLFAEISNYFSVS